VIHDFVTGWRKTRDRKIVDQGVPEKRLLTNQEAFRPKVHVSQSVPTIFPDSMSTKTSFSP
jgi:hypothetical protein